MSIWPKFSISDGAEGKDRFPAALEHGYFLPDERGFEESLALGSELARTLPFYDLGNRTKGTWGDLFDRNEAAVMALMLSKDIEQLQSGFSLCMELGLEEAMRHLYQTACEIDFWLVRLSDSSSRAGIELSQRMEALVRERLAAALRTFAEVLNVLRGKTRSLDALDFSGFHAVWRINQARDGAQAKAGAATPTSSPASLSAEVRRIFAAFVNVIEHLRSIVRPYLIDSLDDGTHEPAVALFMVFLKLLETARNRLNTFTERHLDFYYHRMLGAVARPHQPDHVFFALETVEGENEVRIPAGTEFVTNAGSGGAEIVVVGDQDAVISDAKVAALCTLRFERDPFISPERELGYVTRIKALERDPNRAAGAAALPLFGTGSQPAGDEWAHDARIGFAVASPVLLLREGQRTIDVKVELEDLGEASPFINEVLRRAESARDPATLAEIFAHFLNAERDWLHIATDADTDREAKRLASDVALRELEEAFEATSRTGRNRIYDLFLLSLLRQPIGNAEDFYRLLGRIFRRYLLSAGEYWDAELKREIGARAKTLLEGDSLDVVMALLHRGRQEIFQTLLKDLFEISLTVPNGWHRVDKYALSCLGDGGEGARNGLQFALSLGPAVDPIVSYLPEVHGGQWGGTSPLIRFRLNPRANFCAYSLLNASQLSTVVIDVEVRGLRDLRSYNNLGRIDPSKPFQPFGPLPQLSAYFAFGSYEMAQKQLTGLTLNLEWAELPSCLGGFAAHYTGYEQAYAGDEFQVDVSVLQDGTWQPQPNRQRALVSLFGPAGPTDKLQASRSIPIEVLDFFQPVDPKIAEEQLDLQLGVRNGFFRLGLSSPEGAFGHADYPILLSKALSENIRSKVFNKVPNAPYTPLIAQMSVDYKARARIRVDETRSAERWARDQRIFHLHPFGYEEVQPIRAGKAFSLLPKYDTDGNLFIGLTSGSGGRNLRLVFHLSEETSQQTAFESPELAWYYLSGRGWRRLPTRNVLLDTTNGFLCSGIVSLTLPEDLDRQSPLMPAGKAWVRVGVNAHLDSFPRLYSVHANGVRATRRIDTAAGETLTAHLPAGCEWRSAVSIPGLGAIVQLGESSGGAPTENRRRFHTRISERLRHKQRATTAWDYEHLVLERFPDVFKVKCFAGLVSSDTKPRPGHILLVVVPYPGEGPGLECRRPMLDVLQLTKIRRFVQELASPFVEVEVRNPLYEVIQVRCKAKFVDEANPGFYIRKLDHEVSEFLCPWIPFGCRARFGWTITREEIEGFIRGRDYVEFVTDFSMLHVVQDAQDSYSVADTVSRDPVDEAGEGGDRSARPSYRRSDRVCWRYPWSLAVPIDRHFIDALRTTRPIEPEPTGIGELDIGRTFSVNGTD